MAARFSQTACGSTRRTFWAVIFSASWLEFAVKQNRTAGFWVRSFTAITGSGRVPASWNATTNYELYKGLYSSHNDRNYFELSHTLKRQFGDDGNGGLYRDLPLYTFADNHDVPRIASLLHEPAHLYPLHILLLTMPGVPSLYSTAASGA